MRTERQKQLGPGRPRPARRWSVVATRREEIRSVRKSFTIQGLRRRCAPKHRNIRHETAGWDRIDHQEVSVLCCHGPGAQFGVPGPQFFRRLWFNGRMSPCQGDDPGAIPGGRSTFDTPCASLRSRASKTQRAWGSTKAACHSSDEHLDGVNRDAKDRIVFTSRRRVAIK